MNTDIVKVFKEKNIDILTNNLFLVLERNSEGLNLSICTNIDVKLSNLIHDLVKECNDKNCNFDYEKLKEIILDGKLSLKDSISNLINEKKNQTANFFDEQIIDFNKKTINKYVKHILNSSNSFVDKANIVINNSLINEIEKNVKSIFKGKHDDISKMIILSTSKRIQDYIKTETEGRDRNLINITKESYNTYLDINKQSQKIKNKKIKIE